MIEYLFLVLGLAFLIKGADLLVDGSASLARKFSVPTIVIGLTIVAFGTSTPELIINILAALKGSTELAFGNIIGSNIANILLVLGVTALIFPIKVEASTIWKGIPFTILAVAVLFVVSNYLLIDNIDIKSLTRVSGILLLLFFTIFVYYSVEQARKSKKKIEDKEISVEKRSGLLIAIYIILGLIGLYFGGRWVVDSAITIAMDLGLSEFLVSATIVAIGTSLPELVTGIQAARKTETGIAVGNAVGSNIFNIFWILGITALIAPIAIPDFINTDLLILGAASLLLFIFVFVGKNHELERWQGGIFIGLYIAYIVFVVMRG